ncbi:DMT family transporter [Salinarimonas chemoclinalis]|uniref:DMT family transporter n=1 Tax=Salinarimonas chemoclinalis TaxID=3241599 RepID=UPI00355626F0
MTSPAPSPAPSGEPPQTDLDAPLDAAASRERLAAIGLMCAALICFSCLDTSAKWLGEAGLPTLQVVFLRYLVSIVLISAFVNGLTTPGVTRSARPGLQVLRSLFLMGGTLLNFTALRWLQLAETMAIMFSTPFIVALIAGPLLGERVGPRRLAAIAVGFVGVLVVVRPGIEGFHPAALLSIGAAVCNALYGVTTRMLAGHDGSRTTLVYSGLVGLAVTAPIAPFVWEAPPSVLSWLLLAGLGAFGAVGHWLLILAHARAPAAALSPFFYTQIVWMLALGWLVFGDLPDAWTLVGAAVVVASGLYLLARERARTRRS